MAYLDEDGVEALWEDVEKAIGNATEFVEGSLVKASTGAVLGPLASVSAEGWAEQVSTTGKNLNAYDYSTTIHGVSIAYDGTGKVSVSGTAAEAIYAPTGSLAYNNGFMTLLAAGTYMISVSSLPNGVSVTVIDDSGTTLAQTSGSPVSFTLASDTYVCARVVIASGASVNDDIFIQLEAGSTATEYEPYTGGAPSPSPDYPQEIQVVRGHEVMGKTGRFVDLVVKQGNTTLSTTPIPLPERGWVAGLSGGMADVLSIDSAGKVEWTNNTNEVVLDGTENWYYNATNNFAYTYTTKPADGGDFGSGSSSAGKFLLDRFIVAGNGAAGTAYASDANILFFCGGAYSPTSSVEAKAWATANPITLLYPLATPVTEDCGYVDLPDIPGEVTVSIPELADFGCTAWVDDDGTIHALAQAFYERSAYELTAATAQAKADMLGSIAPVEGATASTNYAVDTYLVHDGKLCKVTSAIATGEAIIIGTNVTATTVMAEILAIQE